MKKFLIGGSAPKSVAPVVANKIAASLTLKSELSSSTTSDLSKPIAAEDDKSHIFNTTSSFTSLDDMNISKSLRDFISWQPGESIPYAVVVNTFEDVSRLSGRLDKENLLAKLFASVICTSPSELEAIVYLTSNNVYPVYEGLELGVGDSLLVKAVCEATGRKKDAVDEAYEKEGDLGVVAVQSRTSQKTLGFGAKPKPLMASYVLDQFRQITQIKGEKAQARKVEIIKSLMVRCQGQEAKYIVRALQGKLRIGTAEQTVLVALAHALIDSQKKDKTVTDTLLEDSDASGDEQSNDKKSKKLDSMKVTSPDMTLQELLGKVDDVETFEARKLRLHAEGNQQLSKEKLYEYAEIAVKRAYSECPNLGLLLEASVTKPLHQLYQNCKLRNGVPVAPMLAKPTKEINEVLRRLSGQAFTMEYKYDGERAQVHLLPDSSVKIFSRNSEDNTEKYPDLREVIR